MINLGKSEIVPIGEVEDVDFLAHVLECRLGSLPDLFGFAVGGFFLIYFYLEWSSRESGTKVG
jgi:hypothetical protein